MEVVASNYMPEDPRLVDQIVYELKSQGIFDQFRKECISDVDTKPAYQNLRQRVEGSVTSFLRQQRWKPDMNKNQVREMLRKNIYESGFLEIGVERIVDQVVNPKINTIFLPRVEEVVYRFFGVEKPTRNDSSKKEPLNIDITQNDLLPKDLEAVSPESVNTDKKEERSFDESGNTDDMKMDEDESPPFEPLEEQTNYLQHEENSVDSHMSGFSGLASHESNHSSDTKGLQIDLSNQDSQMSRNSSESRLSIITSDDNTKMEICDDSQSKSLKSNDSNSKIETTIITERDTLSEEAKKSESLNKSKNDVKKSRSSDKYKSRSDKDRKDDRSRKSSSSSSRDKSRHSSFKDKSKERRDSKTSSSKDKKDDKPDRDKDKSDRDKDKEKSDKGKSSSKKSSSSNSKDRSGSRKDGKDKDKSRSSSSSTHKDSKSKSSHSDSRSKSSSSDKHKKDDKYSHSNGKHSSSSKRDKDKKKDSKRELKDDHYSSKEKKTDRRSTDRDSNDGQSSKHSNSSSVNDNNSSQSQKNSQESNGSNSGNGSGDSGNSDTMETRKTPKNISETVENTQVVFNSQESSTNLPAVRLFKPKVASNFHEAKKLMKIRKQLAKLEKQNKLSLSSLEVDSTTSPKVNGFNRDAEEVEEKENKQIVKSTIGEQNSVLSKERWDALEARLYQEMSNISNTYDSNEDENDSTESVAVVTENTAQNQTNNNQCRYLEKPTESLERNLEYLKSYVNKLEKDIGNNLIKNSSIKIGNKRKIEDQADVKNNNKKIAFDDGQVAKKKRKLNALVNNADVSSNDVFLLSLSPAKSDVSNDKNDDLTVPIKIKRNKSDMLAKQRYSSDDLYKPRPIFASSRRRGAKNLEN